MADGSTQGMTHDRFTEARTVFEGHLAGGQDIGASISPLRTAIGAVPLGFEDRLHQLGEAMSLEPGLDCRST